MEFLKYFLIVAFWIFFFGALGFFLFRKDEPIQDFIPKTKWQKQSPYFPPDPFLTE